MKGFINILTSNAKTTFHVGWETWYGGGKLINAKSQAFGQI